MFLKRENKKWKKTNIHFQSRRTKKLEKKSFRTGNEIGKEDDTGEEIWWRNKSDCKNHCQVFEL